jgi:hypothetical protein
MTQDEDTVHYDSPSGGFGSLEGVARTFGKEWATHDKLSKTPAATGMPVRIIA